MLHLALLHFDFGSIVNALSHVVQVMTGSGAASSG